MSEFTIIIDNWSHKELKDYLSSLKGILEVTIRNDDLLEIDIKYDSNFITPKIMKMEILLFLDILKVPSILAFDKHPKVKTLEYKIIKKDICCEYCFKGAIDDLFEIDGIEKVDSNFNEENCYQRKEDIIIHIRYNPSLISMKKMEQIESNLNL